MSSKDSQYCLLCQNQPSKYCCPRCGVLYCSLECYKSTNHLQCAESFYEDCVRSELASEAQNKQPSKEMLDILSRVKSEDLGLANSDESFDSDDEPSEDLALRMKNIDIEKSDEVWNALNDDEKNEFEALVKSGNIDSLIKKWIPWWTYKDIKTLITELNQEESPEKLAAKCPKLIKIKDFSDMCKTKPAPNVQYNILNVLAAFVFTARYFNGDYCTKEAVSCLASISNILDRSDVNFDEPETAVESVVQECLASQFVETDESSIDTMRHDIYLVLSGPSKDRHKFYTMCCLSEVHQIIHHVRKIQSKCARKEVHYSKGFKSKFLDHPVEHIPHLDTNKLKKIEKKLEYFLSYVEKYGLDLL